MGVHHSSIFRYQSYQDDMRPLVEQVDQQNYDLLKQRVQAAIRRFQREWPRRRHGWCRCEGGRAVEELTQEWPLFEHGEGGLPTETEIQGRADPTPAEIGEWFLIILGEYVRPCPSPHGNWTVLDATLSLLGWEKDERALLFQGMPTYKLLKPDTEVRDWWHRNQSSPYWLYLHPESSRAGWLASEQVSRLYRKLREDNIAKQIPGFDIRQIPNINADNPIVVKDYRGYLRSAYRDTLAMLEAASAPGDGLFMSIIVA